MGDLDDRPTRVTKGPRGGRTALRQGERARTPLALLEALYGSGRDLPREVAAEILGRGTEMIELLLEILEQEDPHAGASLTSVWAAVHAARLLGRLRAAAAVEPLLRLLEATRPTDPMHEAAIDALRALAPAALDPALAAYAETVNPRLQASLCRVLAGQGVRDERISRALATQQEA